LRLLDFGGSVMHRSTIDALRRAFPGVDLIQTYGLTEAGPGGLYLPPEYLDAKIGSIGCVPSGDLRFRVDTSKTEEYESGADGVIGELLFAGSSIMLGYLDDPAATASVFDGEWMRTGDLVRVDADGFVYFLDRLKDLIIRGGYNISSIEIEETFLTFPNVRKAAAFGVPHRTLGEVVGIAIVPEDPRQLDLDALRALAEQRLPRVKVPAWVVVLDDLPVSSAGKVLKSALRSHPDLREWTGSAGAS
jgi:acyl-CoA synthetase (AMP-forming)/AMP-acid ligase II